jgi:hypothetical protein
MTAVDFITIFCKKGLPVAVEPCYRLNLSVTSGSLDGSVLYQVTQSVPVLFFIVSNGAKGIVETLLL